MEVKSNMRRAQSLRSISADHSLSWTEAGLRDRRKSVSQLVAQYQNSAGGKAKAKSDSVENQQRLTLQFTAIPVTGPQTKPDSPLQSHESKERPKVRSSLPSNTPLTRSKSMEILPRQNTISTSALRELYEEKVAMQAKSGQHPNNYLKPKYGHQLKGGPQPRNDLQLKSGPEPNHDPPTENAVINHRVTEEITVPTDSGSINNCEKQGTAPKEEHLTPKVVRTPRSERRKTITGVYTEKISTLEDDKRRSIADFRDNHTLYGRETSPLSVKAMSALYLSKVAAAEPAGSPLKTEQGPPSPTRQRITKMADVAQKEPEPQSAEDPALPYVTSPVPPNNSRDECQSPVPTPPLKEAVSNLYQQRQKCELKRLLKHTCPELKGLGNVVDEEFADILNSGLATDISYGGEVQSRRWIFENGAVNTGELPQTQAHWMQKCVEGGHVFEQASICLQGEESKQGRVPFPLGSSQEHTADPEQECEALAQEESFRVDVKAKRKMFECQSRDTSRDSPEDVFPGKVVVSAEEKGEVQKQRKDFETYQSDPVKRSSPLNITDITDIGQEGGGTYGGISKAKEIFEKGSQGKESSSAANENIDTEDEIWKTNVRNRTQMFESTPLDRINWQNEGELDTVVQSMSRTLASLHNFSVIHSHGILIEASEAGHVRKAKYNLIQEEGPEIQHEETVMGSMKSILLQLLARANINSLVAFLKEDDQGNVEIKNVQVPTHQLPFTVNQDKEYRTTIMVQVIEDLLGQETSLGKGVLIQDCEMGSVDILAYVLYRHDGHDGTGQTAHCLLGSGETTREQTSQTQLEITPQEEAETLSQEGECRVDVKATRKIFEDQLVDTLGDNLKDVFHGRDVSEEEKGVLISGKGDDTLVMYTPPPPIQDDDSTSLGTEENKTSNVKLFRSCIEKGELDYLKQLQRSSSEEDLFSSQEREQNVIIAPGNFKMIKAIFTNPDNAGTSLPSDNLVQKQLNKTADSTITHGNDSLPSRPEIEQWFAESHHVEPERSLQCQNASVHENVEEGMVIQTELVDIAEDNQLLNLQAAILSLQQATEEARALQQSIQEKQQEISLENSTNPTTAHDSEDNQNLTHTTKEDSLTESLSSNNSETGHHPEESEEAMKGRVQAALDSLGKSNFNVTKGDFKAAMIYRHSGKTFAGQKNIINVETAVKESEVTATSEENKACHCSPCPGLVTPEAKHEGAEAGSHQGQTTNKPMACPPRTNQTHTETSVQSNKRIRPKPAIPPKPDHLKVNLSSKTVVILGHAGDMNKSQAEPNSKPKQCAGNESLEQQSQGHTSNSEGNPTAEDTRHQILEESQRKGSENMLCLNDSGPEFQTALQNFGMKTGRAIPPVKPKRIKMATSSIAESALQNDPNTRNSKPNDGGLEGQPEVHVTMREKKVRKESEEERRQRLSVHMDEIMRENASAAMDIFDQLRRQEELKNILSKVEEIEEDTSKEHVSDLQKIFESVPDWVVPENSPKNTVVDKKAGRSEMVCERELMSSMQVAYGDLEKASAAIITLKEQTLSRLMDIEETIKKALCSVSTLKSDSDIAGLSGLFKESMMDVQSSSVSGNIRKISIGSSKSPKAESGNTLEVPGKSFTEDPAMHAERFKPGLSLPTPKPRSGSPSSPSFISIQSAARKNANPPTPSNPQNPSPKAETFQSTTCYNMTADHKLCCVTKCPSCCPAKENRQVSTLEVQTIPEGEKVIGTKTIREKYEEMDCFGNKFYSSKTSTVMTTQPEPGTCFRRQITSRPATSEVVTFPRINMASVNDNHASS